MLRPLLLALGCFLLFPPGFDGAKAAADDDKDRGGEIASLLKLLGKNNFKPVSDDYEGASFYNKYDSRVTYSFAVIVTVLFVLILIAVLFLIIYKICIEHKKLTFLCNVSPSDFTGRGQDAKTSFSIATTL
uniref:Uncharacterized protein n=1 Tax=Globodera rostochiensis TaxID=31243 RepID=A0A914HSU6_GLORO